MPEDVESDSVSASYKRASVARIILAFLICPALPLAVALGLERIGLFMLFGGPTLGVLSIVGVVSYLAAFVVGIPLYLLMAKRGKFGLGEYVLWGCAIALVLSAPVPIVMPFTIPLAFVLSILLWVALVRIPPKIIFGARV